MNFSQRQADPRRHLMGISLVVAFHLIVVYALVTGLAKKVVDVVRAPIETKVIEEIKKPPPLPEVVLPPPPKLDAPPPPYIPPPEVQIAAPPPPQPAITATTPTPPAAPFNLTPPTPAVTPAAPRAAVLAMAVACASQVQPVMPAKATREGINGSVRARATIRGGKVIAVDILSSSPRGVFDAAVRTAMLQYGCQAGDEEIKAEQTFDFKIAE
jgi:periplasmic protein TonB